MRSIKWLTLTIALSGCGTHMPPVTDYFVLGNQFVHPHGKTPVVKSIDQAEALAFICESPADFLNSRLYINNLEQNLATCNQQLVSIPSVVLCGVYATGMSLICSNNQTLPLASVQKYICVSGADYEIIKAYKTGLLNKIAACK